MLKRIASLVAVGSMLTVSATASAMDMTDDQMEDLVRQSWRFVAMYNVNNKTADRVGGWNTVQANTELLDHTVKLIARPCLTSAPMGQFRLDG